MIRLFFLEGDCPRDGSSRDAFEEGDDIVGYHGLLWLKFEMENLFSNVLGVLDVVWAVQ